MNKLLLIFIWAIPVACSAQQTGVLEPKEKEALVYMREEEKLARDVYDSLYARWNINPFGNIRHSEQVHMDKMKALLETYGIEDPVADVNEKPGIFSSSVLQHLYQELTSSGSQSVTTALLAGAKIEEMDISDLNARMALTSRNDINTTFRYLVMASENHLRAFVRRLKSEGINYEPVILEHKEFDRIISSSNNMGHDGQQ